MLRVLTDIFFELSLFAIPSPIPTYIGTETVQKLFGIKSQITDHCSLDAYVC